MSLERWWTDHVVPRLADKALDTPPVHDYRARACAGLTGHVLEIGLGSGLNIDHYPAGVTAVDAVEPSDVGWAMASARVRESRVPVRRTGLDGQHLTAADATYDAALSTFSLCTIPDALTALREVRRVLKPGGLFHFLEHGLAPDTGVVTWQRRLNPVQRRVAGGCHLDRPIPQLVEAAGFAVESVECAYLPGPAVTRPFGYVYVGRARVPA